MTYGQAQDFKGALPDEGRPRIDAPAPKLKSTPR